MPGSPNPIDILLVDAQRVEKPDFRSFLKTREVLLLADADEVRATDLSGQLTIQLQSTGRTYKLNTGDATTPDDGEELIRDGNGLAFELNLIDGIEGPEGPAGPQGEKGDTGDEGPQGPPGADGAGAVDSVNGQTGAVTLDAGDIPTDSNSPPRTVADEIANLTQLASINGGQLAGFRNLLINADGRFNQRGPATNADNTYGHDRWLALTQTSTIAVSTVSDAENGTPRMWRLSQSQSTAQRMGYAQWIEGANCRHLRGKTVTLSGRIKFSLNASVRYAICEWTGSEDAPSTARDVVNDWTDGAFTAGHFFKSTTFNVLATGSITPAAATLTDLTKLSATVGSTANNLVIFIWTEGTAAQNATLDGSLQLEQGSVATVREFRPFSIEYMFCQRYYFKTFNLNTTPAQNIGTDAGEMLWGSMTGASVNGVYHFRFPCPMRSVTPSGTLYNPSATNAQVRNVTDSTDCTGTSMNSYQAGASIFYTTPAGTAVGDQLRVHGTWDAEI